MICSRKMMLAMLLATAVSAMKNVRPADRIRALRRRRRLPETCISKKEEDIVNLLKGGHQNRVALGNAYEECFNLKVKTKLTQTIDTTLFNQEWEDVEGITKNNTTPQNKLRIVQFNILAHGLSSDTSGFASIYKSCKDIEDIEKSLDNAQEQKKIYKKWLKKHSKANKSVKIKQKKECDAKVRAEEHKPMISDDELELLLGKTWGDEIKDVYCRSLMDAKGTYKNETKALYPFPERLKRVVGLVLRQEPDVITMQEVDRFDEIRTILRFMGYEGCIQRKKDGAVSCGSNAPTHPTKTDKRGNPKGTGVSDGVAIFWNKNKIENPLGGNMALKRGRLDDSEGELSNQVYIFAKLRFKGTKNHFIVATAHLKSGKAPRDLPTKIKQAEQMGKLIEAYSEANRAPVIFGSDFNNACGDKGFDTFYPNGPKANKNGKSKTNWQTKNLKSSYKLEPYVLRKMKWKNDKKEKNVGEPTAMLQRWDDGIWKNCEVMTKSHNDELKLTFLEKEYTRKPIKNKLLKKFNDEEDTTEYTKSGFYKVYIDEESTSYRLAAGYWEKVYKKEGHKKYSVIKWRKGGSQKNKIDKEEEAQTIDFIFHTKPKAALNGTGFKTLATLSIPTYKTVKEGSNGLFLPCWKYPSDHFMIGADLELVKAA